MKFLALLMFVDVAFAKQGKIIQDLNPRVTQGKLESILDSPYQVLVIHISNSTRSNCGGSILSKFSVVTAAHCVSENYSYIQVLVGSSTKDAGHPYLVQSLKIHPEYDSRNLINDIAILKTYKPIAYSGKVKPIGLARRVPPVGTMLKVSGWGMLDQSTLFPVDLHSAEIPLADMKLCEAEYPRTTNIICAGFPRGPSDCSGDSGGPLVFKKRLLGIISFGMPCGLGPSGYTSVPALRDWIVSNVHWSYTYKGWY